MTNRHQLIGFFCVSLVLASQLVQGNKTYEGTGQKNSASDILKNVTWESAQDGNLPPMAVKAGEEGTSDGSIYPTYVARAVVSKFGPGPIPGYFSSYKRKVIIVGLEGGPYYADNYEVLTIEPKWELVEPNAKHIPLKAIPTGRFGFDQQEPAYTCQTEIGRLKRIGVMWWGETFCHVCVGIKKNFGLFEYNSEGSHKFEIMVA